MSSESSTSPLGNILLVEDNENDALLTRESFRQEDLAVNMHHVSDGQQCMKYLRKEGEYANAPTPDLVLLDLNMPVMSGQEVLKEIVSDQRLSHLPVAVLTTSSRPREVLEAYRLRCNAYIVKPVDFHAFAKVVRETVQYWFSTVRLPTR